jgi:hypothetical protein
VVGFAVGGVAVGFRFVVVGAFVVWFVVGFVVAVAFGFVVWFGFVVGFEFGVVVYLTAKGE